MKNKSTIIKETITVKSILKSLLRIIRGVVIGLIIGGFLLYLFQDKFIFMPQDITKTTLECTLRLSESIEEINLKTKDGTNLHGWFINNKSTEVTNLLFYFGGNAEEVSYMVDEFRRYADWSAVFINYRGYGLSEGSPSEKNLYSDALEIYDYFLEKREINNTKIVVMGRSIGTGVATYLASNRKSDGVILISPYDSLISVGQEKFPIYPINLMVKHKFNSIERAPKIIVPLKIIIASEDQIIPPWHSKDLAKKWGGKVDIKEIQGEDHNSVSDNEEYWKFIKEFLESFLNK